MESNRGKLLINPFMVNGYLSTNASINKLTLSKMPEQYEIKENLKGKTALDVFSTDLLIEEIKKRSKELKLNLNNIEEKSLPYYLNLALESSEEDIRKTAEDITKIFGERLAVILLTLRKGYKESRSKRKDWEDSPWQLWSELETVILAGGLASSKIGERFKYYIEEVFKKEKESCYNIILNKDSSNMAIKGCSTFIKYGDINKSYLVFDFGQSFIKRSLVKIQGSKLEEIINLDKVISKYVTWEFNSLEEEKKEAYNLNKYILQVIKSSIDELIKKGEEVGEYIPISIANYVKEGNFVNRGGYGKLRLISSNYEEYLSDYLYDKYNKRFVIKLIHDGTAMAKAFDNYNNSVCISLGTAFGIGFPNK